MNTIAVSQSCVWLMAVGGIYSAYKNDFASSCLLLELSEWQNEITNKQAETCDK